MDENEKTTEQMGTQTPPEIVLKAMPNEQIIVIRAIFGENEDTVQVIPESYVHVSEDEDENDSCATVLIAYALCEAAGVPQETFQSTIEGIKQVLNKSFQVSV